MESVTGVTQVSFDGGIARSTSSCKEAPSGGKGTLSYRHTTMKYLTPAWRVFVRAALSPQLSSAHASARGTNGPAQPPADVKIDMTVSSTVVAFKAEGQVEIK